MQRWDTIKDFYTERGGEFSGEQDMGVWHWDDIQIFDYPRRISPDRQPATVEVADESYLAYTATGSDRVRVSVVAETGDVYAMRFKTGEVALLGNVGITDPERGLSNSKRAKPGVHPCRYADWRLHTGERPAWPSFVMVRQQAGRQFNVASIAGAASRRSQGRSSRTSKKLSFTRIRYRPRRHLSCTGMPDGHGERAQYRDFAPPRR